MADAKRNGSVKRKNVQVAVRVRPMNEKEKGEGARQSVVANTVANYISVRERNSRKEFGPFDKVYDASCRQHDVYSALVKPLIPQLLLGYNATIFAYGQTGTGKTFTMAGESDPNHVGSWQDDPGMGIIPRALQQLFDELQAQDSEEYSVRVSYVELYNEELFDLLARPGSENQRLRIFDDNTRKGSVIISGVEDVSVQSSDDVYEVLRKGAEKRKTAATLMNMSSSRSHSVFTVTVVTREGKLPGEDLMKTGKLHLVDLAGSENIGRSGAIEQRAREAGSINQSLLTLGRVITALTSGAAHVPYRESKLTRILQDSLGGKTITTIIATLSPSSTCNEETISTLEYAARAKNIKNHPEANQTLSRRALLKAYNDEVERLKRDLQAAREKNGVFVDKDNFEKMQEELDSQRDQIEEFADRIQAYMSQIEKLMSDVAIMDAQYSKLYERSSKLESKLRDRVAEIEQLNLKLAETESSRDKWKRAAEEVQHSFQILESQRSKLAQTCMEMSADLDGAHAKIQRLSDLIARNEACLKKLENNHKVEIEELKYGIGSWKTNVHKSSEKVVEQCGLLQSVAAQRLLDTKERFQLLNVDLEQWGAEQLAYFQDSHEELSKICVGQSEEMLDKISTMFTLMEDHHSKGISFIERLRTSISRLGAEQSQFSSAVEEFVEQQQKIELQTAIKEKANLKEREALYKGFELQVKNFLQAVQEQDAELENVREQRYDSCCSALGSLNKVKDASAQTTDLLLKDMENERNNLENTVNGVKNSVSQELLCLEANVSSWVENVASRSKKSLESFETKVTELVGGSNNIVDEATHIIDDLTRVTKDSLNETCKLAAHTSETSEQSFSLACGKIGGVFTMVKDFVDNDFERPSSTGVTPKPKVYEIKNKAVSVPDVTAMVSAWENEDSPKRKSFYRRRESILENPFVVLSPQTLKGTLSTVDEDPEETEHSNLSGLTRDFPSVNVRRRVLTDRNS